VPGYLGSHNGYVLEHRYSIMDITFFEIHLDGAQFGPKTIGDAKWGDAMADDAMEGERTDEETTVVTGEESYGGRSRSPPRFAPLFVLFVVGAGYVAYRRFRGGDDGDGGESFDADAEAVEIEA
jgi:hypothetical protein